MNTNHVTKNLLLVFGLLSLSACIHNVDYPTGWHPQLTPSVDNQCPDISGHYMDLGECIGCQASTASLTLSSYLRRELSNFIPKFPRSETRRIRVTQPTSDTIDVVIEDSLDGSKIDNQSKFNNNYLVLETRLLEKGKDDFDCDSNGIIITHNKAAAALFEIFPVLLGKRLKMAFKKDQNGWLILNFIEVDAAIITPVPFYSHSSVWLRWRSIDKKP